MSYQVLARKYRPRRFDEMVGQDHVVRALTNALASDRLHHAYLFTGTRGVGKTTVARIFAKCLNCETGVTALPCGECATCNELDEGRFVDLIEVDAASRAKVDETRDLMDNVQFSPARGRFKVYLIDEVHMFSTHSFNALLKTLEEPPPHVKFLLATTDPQKLPITVLSRCLQFHMRQLPPVEIAQYLTQLSGAEGFNADNGGLELIASAASGSMRDALSLLDQAIAHGDGVVQETDVRAMLGVTRQDAVYDLLDAIAAHDAARMLDTVEALAREAPDFEALLGELLAALQRIAVLQAVPVRDIDDAAHVERVRALAQSLSAEDTQLLYQIGILGRRDMPYALEPRSGLEMTLLRMLSFKPTNVPAGNVDVAAGPGATAASVSGTRAATSAAVKTAVNATSAESKAAQSTSASAAATSATTGDRSHEAKAVATDTGVTGGADAGSAPPATGPAATTAPWQTATATPEAKPEATAGASSGAAHVARSEAAAPRQQSPVQETNGAHVDFDAAMDAFRADEEPHVPAYLDDFPTPAPQPVETPVASARGSQRRGGSISGPASSGQALSDGPSKSAEGASSPCETMLPEPGRPVAATSRANVATPAMPGVTLTPDNWIDIAARLEVPGMAGALLANCEFVAHDGATVVMRLASQHDGLNSARAIGVVQQALAGLLGAEVHLDIQMGELQRESLAQSKQQRAAALHASATAAIREDPTVQAICDMFDATVDEQEIRPRGEV